MKSSTRLLSLLSAELDNARRLRFQSDELEQSYIAHFNEENLVRHRIACMVAIVILFIFAPQDMALFPEESKPYYLLIRMGICVPFLVLGFIVSYLPSGKNQMSSWVVTGILLIGLGCVAIVVINQHFNHTSPYEGVLLTIIAGFFLAGLDFRSALMTAVMISLTFIMSVWLFYADKSTAIYDLSFTVSIVLIGAAGGYEMEKQHRINYINHQILKLTSQRDGLTGLLNRKAFDEALDQMIRYSIREKKQLAVMMLDVDHFKQFNDHYGHQAGDN